MYDIIDEKNLLEFMFEHQVTQTELAKQAKIQRKTLYNILHCRHKPSFYVQSCLYKAMKTIAADRKKANKKSG